MTKLKDEQKLKEFQDKVIENYKGELQALKNKEDENRIRNNINNYRRKLEEFKESRIKPNREGKSTSDWQESDAAAEHNMGGTAAYNSEWKIAMLGLVEALMSLNRALSNSATEVFMEQHLNLKQNNNYIRLTEGLRSLLNSKPKDAPPLPILLQGVTMNNSNVLEVSITKKQGTAFNNPDDFNNLFKEVVVEWLGERGFKPKHDPACAGQFFDAEGNILTKEVFDTMKKDPNNGFEHYLKDNSDLEFEEKLSDSKDSSGLEFEERPSRGP